MAITKETLDYVAHLARIDLNSQELDKLAGQLQGVLSFIDILAKADIKDIPATSHILPISNILRQDSLRDSLPVNSTLANAPQKEGNFFVVPKVIE